MVSVEAIDGLGGIRNPFEVPTGIKEIAFIDGAVADLDTLLAGLRPEVEPVLLDALRPIQMANVLRGRGKIAAIISSPMGNPERSVGAMAPKTLVDMPPTGVDRAALVQTGSAVVELPDGQGPVPRS
jgi:hypothetical protein